MLVDSIKSPKPFFSKWQSDRSAIVGQKPTPKGQLAHTQKLPHKIILSIPIQKQQSHVLYFLSNFLLNLFEPSPSSTSSRANSALISLNNLPKPICLFLCKPFVKSSVIRSLTISENNVTSSVSTSNGLTGCLAVSIMADFKLFRLCALTVEYLRQAYNPISSP